MAEMVTTMVVVRRSLGEARAEVDDEQWRVRGGATGFSRCLDVGGGGYGVRLGGGYGRREAGGR